MAKSVSQLKMSRKRETPSQCTRGVLYARMTNDLSKSAISMRCPHSTLIPLPWIGVMRWNKSTSNSQNWTIPIIIDIYHDSHSNLSWVSKEYRDYGTSPFVKASHSLTRLLVNVPRIWIVNRTRCISISANLKEKPKYFLTRPRYWPYHGKRYMYSPELMHLAHLGIVRFVPTVWRRWERCIWMTFFMSMWYGVVSLFGN
jgi:hypothetical protein